MPNVPILNARKDWNCPNCEAVDQTNEARPHTRMHNCRGMGGLSLPMTEKKRVSERSTLLRRKAQVRAVVREDYIGEEKGLVYDESGRPIMAAVTEYPDGTNDVAVFAPVARIDMRQV